jgi:beta-mannosidase
MPLWIDGWIFFMHDFAKWRRAAMSRVMAATLAWSAWHTPATAVPPDVKLGAYAAPAAAFSLNKGWRLQAFTNVNDSGSVVSLPNYASAGWYPAVVPGTVLSSLVGAGVYPEPLYGTNNWGIPDSLSRMPYWYRTEFALPSDYAGNRVWLNFNGINYTADVWLNGHNLGQIQGAFARGQFDVTSCARMSGANALAVLVTPQPTPGTPHQKTMAGGTGSNGGATAQDGPTFLCTIGWDWIPTIRDRDTGIWQDVSVSGTGPIIIRDPYVTSQISLPDTSSAELTLQVTLSNTTAAAQSGVLSGEIDGAVFQKTVALPARSAQTLKLTSAEAAPLRLAQPRLWWPNGFGAPNLYALKLSVSVGGVVSDSRSQNFGVRQVDHLAAGSSNLTLVVNGVPVIARGGDWGMDEALKRAPRSRLEAQIRMHQQANYTIIRNWVGQSTSEDFYDLCDRYGLLVWDEFFQPNPADGPNPTNSALYLANVREKLLRFRQHPCIALWCGRNEGNPAPAEIAIGNSNLIAELDPVRFYQPSSSSGLGVRSSGPYYWRAPRLFYTVDAAFKTEIGSVSVPTLEGIQSMMPASDWTVINDAWAEHDLCGGAQRGDSYASTLATRYGPISSLADFARKSQLANYEAFRAMYEGRFARLFNPVTGVITWMSNPSQPSFVWQIYSWDLEPLSSLFASRKACEPIHIMLNQSNWHWMVINSTPRTASGLSASLGIYNLDGSCVGRVSNSVAAAATAATDLGLVTFPGGVSDVHFVKLELRDATGALVSDNFYWRERTQDNFQTLDSLPQVSVGVQPVWQQAGGNCIITATLSNPAPVVALMSHVQLRRAGSGQRVLPVFYSDNYISLLPGESRTLTIEAAMEDLRGEAPLLAVDGWNVTAAAEPAVGNRVSVAPNLAAMARSGAVKIPGGPLRINAGGGLVGPFQFGSVASNSYVADTGYSGGKASTTSSNINTAVAHAAPATVYQSERWGTFSYVLAAPSRGACLVRLHFAEVRFAPGGRQFNVAINGAQVLTNFDISGAAGLCRAVVRDFVAVPDLASNVTVSFSNGAADQPKVCGLELCPLSLGMSSAASGSVNLTWPEWLTSGTLYSATNLVPPVSWVAVTDAVGRVQTTNGVTLPVRPGNRFFQWRDG